MSYFNPLEYLSGLTTYVFDIDVLRNVAYSRGISEYTEYIEIDEKTEALCLADLLFAIYNSPDSTAKVTLKHGNFTKDIGSQTYNSKSGILNVIRKIYTKYKDDFHLAMLPDESITKWVNEDEYDY